MGAPSRYRNPRIHIGCRRKIKVAQGMNDRFVDLGIVLDVQSVGGGKFSGYANQTSVSGDTLPSYALEIWMSDGGQKLEWRPEASQGAPIVFTRFDETKPPTVTPVVGRNLIPNTSFEEGVDLPTGWVPKAGERGMAVPKDGATPAHVWDATQS